MARLDSGVSLNAAGEEICSGVSIDKKTVRRWKHFWNKMMEEEENGLLEQTLTFVPAIVLPVGEAKKAVAGSLFQWLSYVWRQGSGSIPHFESVGLFTRLLRLHSSLSLAVVP